MMIAVIKLDRALLHGKLSLVVTQFEQEPSPKEAKQVGQP